MGIAVLRVLPAAVAGFVRQRMNKNGAYTATTTSAVVPAWTSDPTEPATIVGDALDVSGSTSYGSIQAPIWITRSNNVSGSIEMIIAINGVTQVTATTALTHIITLAGRPFYLTYVGPLASGDDVTIKVRRITTSATVTVTTMSRVYVEGTDTSFLMQRMLRSTTFAVPASRGQVTTTWVLDPDNFFGASLSSNQLATNGLTGAGMARLVVQVTGTGHTTATFWLMKNGVDIGSVVFASGEEGTKILDVPVTWASGDTLRLDAQRGSSSFTRTMGVGTSVEAFVGPPPILT